MIIEEGVAIINLVKLQTSTLSQGVLEAMYVGSDDDNESRYLKHVYLLCMRIFRRCKLPTCPICYDSIGKKSIYTTPCGHVFHDKCFDKWRDFCDYSVTCPMCRCVVELDNYVDFDSD